MRVAVVSPFVDRRHGTERAVAELMQHLAEHYGDHIDLYAQQVDHAALRAHAAGQPAESGVIAWHQVRQTRGPHLLRFAAWLLTNRAARRQQEKATGRKADVIFSPGINALDADVILVHAVFRRLADLQRSNPAKGVRSVHRKLYYGLLCRLERRIYSDRGVTLAAVSHHTARQLAEYFGRDDVAVIPNGVDRAHFSPAKIATLRQGARSTRNYTEQEVVALLVGNDWHNKGLPALVAALAECRSLPLRLMVVGQDDHGAYRAQATKNGVADRVHFVTGTPEILKIYAAADILVAPSLEDSFNLPVLEAMSCGLPVIVSSRAGISEWLTDRKDSLLLRDPEDRAELAAAMKAMAGNTGLRAALGANAVKTAAQFSWSSHADKVRDLLVTAAHRKSQQLAV